MKESRTDWKRIHAMKDEEIDFSDSPELDHAFFAEAVARYEDIKAGRTKTISLEEVMKECGLVKKCSRKKTASNRR